MRGTKPLTDNPLRKAAVFVRSLAPDAAASMLARLSAGEASALRAAIAELDSVDDDERREVANLVHQSRRESSDDGTVELRLSGESPSDFASSAGPPSAVAASLDGAQWLRSLADADPAAIAEFLTKEQPRAIAATISYLSPELGAGVLGRLAPELRRGIVAQLAVQGEAEPESLRVIAAGLAEWLRRQQEESHRRSSRAATLRQLVAASDPSGRHELIDSLAQAEPELARSLLDLIEPPAKHTPSSAEASEPKGVDREESLVPTPVTISAKPRLSPEALERVDGRALAEAVATLGARTALLALASSPETVVRRLTEALPRAVGRDLRSRLYRLGPTTLHEVDRAQASFAEAVAAVVERRLASRTVAGRAA